MHPLRALILDRMREKGWQPKQVEARGVSHATLHRYMNPVRLKQLPRQAILQTLAEALELDVAVVQHAALESLWEVNDTPWRHVVHFIDRDLIVDVVILRRDRAPLSQEEIGKGLALLADYDFKEMAREHLEEPTAYARAADSAPNLGQALRDELDRQSELPSPAPDDDEPR